ncbi:MAG: hypothetical protein IRZ15_05725 [Bryobacteraceae bacterium]|nr:hypothetical protein [Bryobacteraceae bacterium]
MNYAEEFFRQFDGLTFFYETGHWWKVEIKKVRATPRRPAGLKYSLAFFDPDDRCLVRFDNSHGVKVRGRKNPAPFDHWHRFATGEVVPYAFIDMQTLVEDFFKAIDKHLPPNLRSGQM